MKWLNGFYFDEEAPEGSVEITDEKYEELLSGQKEGLTIEDQEGRPVLVDRRLSEQEKNILRIRAHRASECFPIINRNFVINGVCVPWYDTLTEAQKIEVDAWVQAWRDAPETGVVPEKPSWLDGGNG